jgi:hypothetical protein
MNSQISNLEILIIDLYSVCDEHKFMSVVGNTRISRLRKSQENINQSYPIDSPSNYDDAYSMPSISRSRSHASLHAMGFASNKPPHASHQTTSAPLGRQSRILTKSTGNLQHQHRLSQSPQSYRNLADTLR